MMKRCGALALVALTGCTSEPEVYPVSGAVTFDDGSAVNVGLIEFVPLEPGPSARGRILVGGEYQLTTYSEGDGAIPGEYVVVVSQPQLAGALRPAPPGHNESEHAGENLGLGVVPNRYARPDLSGLTATVEPGENRFDFELEAISVAEKSEGD